jgi:hypothetical protein
MQSAIGVVEGPWYSMLLHEGPPFLETILFHISTERDAMHACHASIFELFQHGLNGPEGCDQNTQHMHPEFHGTQAIPPNGLC